MTPPTKPQYTDRGYVAKGGPRPQLELPPSLPENQVLNRIRSDGRDLRELAGSARPSSAACRRRHEDRQGRTSRHPYQERRSRLRGPFKNERPANLPGEVVKGNAIYQQTGRGKNRQLKLMYLLVSKATQPADVPFEADFQQTIREACERSFPQRIMEAMKTRR